MELVTLAKAGLEFLTSTVVLVAALTGSSLSVAGITPVLGPGRAIRLAVSSFITKSQFPPSVRRKEVASIRNWIRCQAGDRHGYYVIVGEKGIGKTYMLGSALSRIPGVV